MVPMTPTVPPAIAAVNSLIVGPITTPFRLSRKAYPVPTVAGSTTICMGRRQVCGWGWWVWGLGRAFGDEQKAGADMFRLFSGNEGMVEVT